MEQKAAISIYLVLIVLMGVLMIATAIASFMLLQQKMSIETGLSSKAYQAADSGMEFALLVGKQGKTIEDLTSEFGQGWMCSEENARWFSVNDCSYCLDLQEEGGKITNFKSIGRCGSVQRAIQVTY